MSSRGNTAGILRAGDAREPRRDTHWSKPARPLGDARFAIVQGYGGFETNLPPADLTAEGVLFAGQDISAEHGGPVRLVSPISTSGRAPSG
jgi:DMSO/TMAO reductase YedYZ molybdopterin-dependent catalytic subunit